MVRGLDGFLLISVVPVWLRCGFQGPSEGWSLPVSGGFGERETPLPIPNRAVKPLSADGTWPFGPGRVGRRRFNVMRVVLRGGPFVVLRWLAMGLMPAVSRRHSASRRCPLVKAHAHRPQQRARRGVSACTPPAAVVARAAWRQL